MSGFSASDRSISSGSARGNGGAAVGAGVVVLAKKWWPIAHRLAWEAVSNGNGKEVIKELWDAKRIVARFGSQGSHWVKIASDTFSNSGKWIFDIWEIHAIKNTLTGEVEEMKTVFPRMTSLVSAAGTYAGCLAQEGLSMPVFTRIPFPLFMLDPRVIHSPLMPAASGPNDVVIY